MPQDEAITVVDSVAQANERIFTQMQRATWLAPMVSVDYYGPNYLLDLAIATRYCEFDVVGKRAYYEFSGESLQLIDSDRAYRPAQDLAKRSSAVRLAALPDGLSADMSGLSQFASEPWDIPGMAIDSYNYSRNGLQAADLKLVESRVNDIELDEGLPCDQLIRLAEQIAPDETSATDHPRWTSDHLKKLVSAVHQQITLQASEEGITVNSYLPDGKHHYLYSTEDLPLTSLPATKELKTYLDATPGLNIQYVFIFLDSQKNRISHVVHTANRNNTVTVPDGTAFVRFGWRVYNSGACTIKQLQWGHRVLNHELVIGRGQHLVLTNHYPSYDDLYRNGFVHSRVAAYADRGLKVDIFRLRKDEAPSYHEFQNVDVITGAHDALQKLLACGHYKTILVHFLDEAMWQALEHHIDRVRVIVWVHGAEIQPWYRRDYNYVNESERSAAKVQSEHRMRFWRGLLRNIPKNLQLVFVSKYFAEEVMEDLGFRLPESKYHIIHNPIDTDLFAFHSKPVEQRKKILSIRPYASRTYANDLSANAIIELSTKPWFKELEFRMVGDGKLFEEVLGPLRQFDNVIIERRFLSQPEIASLHREYGVFLCPSRMDTQGVSRDEAMSSGLVPVTNLIAAIPEFVDESCGILAGPNDAMALAEGIAALYEDPDLFSRKSRAAAERVRQQSSKEVLAAFELKLINAL